jgi:hypothetical protein
MLNIEDSIIDLGTTKTSSFFDGLTRVENSIWAKRLALFDSQKKTAHSSRPPIFFLSLKSQMSLSGNSLD